MASYGMADHTAVDRLLDRLPPALPEDAAEPAGLIALDRGRFAKAADWLTQARRDDPAVQGALRLAGNLAALATADAALAAAVVKADDSAYVVRVGAIAGADDSAVDPISAWRDLTPYLASGSPVGLLGLGDGCMLDRLLADPPALEPGREQCVFVVEPDLGRLRAALTAFDWSENGVSAGRIQWCVGRDWAEHLFEALTVGSGLGPPTVKVTQSLDAEAQAAYDAVMQRYRLAFEACGERVDAYYAGRTAKGFAAALGRGTKSHAAQETHEAGRPGRVLLCTSRFTTVLQYSIADAARAFESLGYVVEVLQESAPHHRLTAWNYRQALDAFKPDAVFMIDHLRREFGACFPAALPFICWIQDDLGNLCDPAAGRSVGLRDFVLTCAQPMYTESFAYPKRQCVYLHKLTAVGEQAVTFADSGSGGDDLVFVSHGSADPEALAKTLLAEHGVTEGRRALVDQVLARYREGRWIATLPELAELVRGIGEPQPDMWVLDVFNRLNNTLYRQQALGWAADAAMRRGLRLSLYGQGWESHPTLSKYARGPLLYGPQVAEVTRRAKVNLQLLPFSCLHQRLLDGIVAGGFFLIRAHPSDDAIHGLHGFIAQHVPWDTVTYTQAVERIGPDLGQELLAWRERVERAIGRSCDEALPAVHANTPEHMALHGYLDLPPQYEAVRFVDAASFDARLDHYLEHAEARRAVVAAQRTHVAQFKSYAAGLDRVMREVCGRLLDEPAGDGVARIPSRGKTPSRRAARLSSPRSSCFTPRPGKAAV